MGIAIALVSLAATSLPKKRLTLEQIVRLSAAPDAPAARQFKVEISALGSTILSVDKPVGEMEMVREFPFPTEYAPPQPATPGSPVSVVPSTPTNFDRINVGWHVRLSVKPHGKLVAVAGTVDYVEAELLPSGYGEATGPIYADHADVTLTPNGINQPRSQTTTTRFQLFAVPGEAYDVVFYRGTNAEKHRIVVTAE